MRKPLSITSPTHAIALSNYLLLGAVGVMYVLEIPTTNLIQDALGVAWANVWAVLLMLSAATCCGTAVAAHFAKRPDTYLVVEAVACLFLSAALWLYLRFLPDTAKTAGVFTLCFALGTIARAIQIWYEKRVLREARKHPAKSDPVLADPRDEPDKVF